MNKKIIGILICILFIGASVVPCISSNETFDDQLDQQQPKNNGSAVGDFYPSKLAQSFRPTLNILTKVQLFCVRDYAASGNLIISIRNSLDGTDLTMVSTPVDTIPTWDNENWVEFDFPDITVIPEYTYFIVWTPTSTDTQNVVYWGDYGGSIYEEDNYHRGSAWSYHPTDGWNYYGPDNDGFDFCFKTYGFNSQGNLPPSVSITYPMNGETVNGTISMNGTVSDPNGISDVDWFMIQIDNYDWIEIDYSPNGIWSYIWDSTTVEDGSHIVRIIASDGSLQSGVVTNEFFVKNKEDPEPEKNPDLFSEGNLIWGDVKPSDIKTGTFTISNIGDPGSELDWFIEEYPSWGTWNFSPGEGLDLTPEDGDVTIQVYITAPDEKESTFNGTIKIVNKENSSDYEIVQVTLTTPKNKLHFNLFYDIMVRLIKRFPFFEKILKQYC